jgi:hypothetical protein
LSAQPSISFPTSHNPACPAGSCLPGQESVSELSSVSSRLTSCAAGSTVPFCISLSTGDPLAPPPATKMFGLGRWVGPTGHQNPHPAWSSATGKYVYDNMMSLDFRNTAKTFRPKKNTPVGAKVGPCLLRPCLCVQVSLPPLPAFKPFDTLLPLQGLQLKRHIDATLGQGNLIEAVRLPPGEDIQEWLAVNTVDFYNAISVLYSTLAEFCTDASCEVMSAGSKVGWQDHLLRSEDAPAYSVSLSVGGPQHVAVSARLQYCLQFCIHLCYDHTHRRPVLPHWVASRQAVVSRRSLSVLLVWLYSTVPLLIIH